MILDELLEFVDATAIATATGAALAGDVIDLGAVPQDFGHGKAMYWVVNISTAVTSGAGATVQFKLMSDAAAAINPATGTVHVDTGAIAKATLVAGYMRVYPMPLGVGNVYERYLGVTTTVGTAVLTAGAFNSFLTYDPSYWKSYADGVN